MSDKKFELKLASGKVVEWQGKDGADAAQRYADAHRGVTVTAWRDVRQGVFPGMLRIVEP